MSREFRRGGGDGGDHGGGGSRGGKPGGVSLTQRLPGRSAAEIPHRGQMEEAFGQDFSFVQAYTGEGDAMAGLGASAAAQGDTVAFADQAPMPWLVAHELTHVVQQQQGGGGGGLAAKSIVSSVDSAAEHEADQVADRVVRGEPAGAISAQPDDRIYRFAPNHHRHATVDGLAGSFSAEEIGAIYASNWERDFSQGNVDIASAAIAWTAVKNHATKHNGDPGATAETFRNAIWRVVNGNIGDSLDESLGGPHTWEHMDAPDDAEERAKADQRWAKTSNGVAGYLMDSKAHVKDQLVAAIDVYRQVNNLSKVGDQIDNWGGVAKPEGYQTPHTDVANGSVTTYFPAGWDGPGMASRDPLREQTADEAKTAGAASDPAHKASLWRVVGQHLGRAMHAFEDFWAHSNWLELAKIVWLKESGIEGPWDTLPTGNAQLKTGTFALPAQCHALGHKLLAMATAFEADFALMLRVYGRTSASTKIDDPKARAGRSTEWGSQFVFSDHALAYERLETDSWTPLGEITDVTMATNNVEELVLSGQYGMEDFLCNRNWLDALAAKGRILIEEGDAESDENSHGKIAKDQPEGGGKDHGGALALAKAANEMVFGPLRAVMDEQDGDKALAATQAQLALIDRMLVAPHAGHPLWGILPQALGGSDGHDH